MRYLLLADILSGEQLSFPLVVATQTSCLELGLQVELHILIEEKLILIANLRSTKFLFTKNSATTMNEW